MGGLDRQVLMTSAVTYTERTICSPNILRDVSRTTGLSFHYMTSIYLTSSDIFGVCIWCYVECCDNSVSLVPYS